MAGRMPGRRPKAAANRWGRIVQRLRLETGLSREKLHLPPWVERSGRRPSELTLDAPSLDRFDPQRVLARLGLTVAELLAVEYGTLPEHELTIRALGRVLDRERREAAGVEGPAWREVQVPVAGEAPAPVEFFGEVG